MWLFERVMVSLNHTYTRGQSVARMQDFNGLFIPCHFLIFLPLILTYSMSIWHYWLSFPFFLWPCLHSYLFHFHKHSSPPPPSLVLTLLPILITLHLTPASHPIRSLYYIHFLLLLWLLLLSPILLIILFSPSFGEQGVMIKHVYLGSMLSLAIKFLLWKTLNF